MKEILNRLTTKLLKNRKYNWRNKDQFKQSVFFEKTAEKRKILLFISNKSIKKIIRGTAKHFKAKNKPSGGKTRHSAHNKKLAGGEPPACASPTER